MAKAKDVVFVVHEDFSGKTAVREIEVRSRSVHGVRVDSCSLSRFRTRLSPGMYFEHYEDAVKSFARKVDDQRRELKRMERDLEAMRKKLR